MTEQQTQQVADLLIQALQVAVLLASLYLVPWVRRWLTARRDQMVVAGRESELRVLDVLASTVVLAVEQQLSALTSANKRATAIAWLITAAAERGLELSHDSAARLVEAAVRVMTHDGLELARPEP